MVKSGFFETSPDFLKTATVYTPPELSSIPAKCPRVVELAVLSCRLSLALRLVALWDTFVTSQNPL